MVSEQNGTNLINGALPDDLADRARNATESHDELTDARLIREGLREVLPNYE